MATIHKYISTWLAADIHGDLSDSERSALHTHLVECAACRRAHQENKVMNKILEETFAQENHDRLSNSGCSPVFASASRKEADS